MDWYAEEFLCHDLPTRPRPELGVVLVTGATGYIGGRLVAELQERGYRVRIMVRISSPEHEERWPDTEIFVADALNVGDLRKVLTGVSVAYYLIHSMLLGKKEFEYADIQAVTNFRFVAEEMDLKRVIYLGGLGRYHPNLSKHLKSRLNVAEILIRSKVPCTVLRAAIIIGSGSASYEIINNLVRNWPVYVIPAWTDTLCQPISIRDVVKYLVGVLEMEETSGKSYEICGDDILSYKEMIQTLAKILRKQRLFLNSPISSIKLYSYFTSLLTPVPAHLIHCLMEGVRTEVICGDSEIKQLIPFKTINYKVSLLRALSREDHDAIYTRWADAYPPANELAMKLTDLEKPPHFISSYSIITEKSTQNLFRSICRIGGKEGWFHTNWMWRLRGFIDRILMGVGTSRGRRSESELRINDVIDFWRVEDLVPDRRLLLRAEMKLPGKAWLEFRILPEEEDRNGLSVIAYFQPRGLPGRLYWYNFLPFHFIIFKDLLKQLVIRS
jgi:uncharacterized protein YbjT (DUF2867 family)